MTKLNDTLYTERIEKGQCMFDELKLLADARTVIEPFIDPRECKFSFSGKNF